MNKNGNQIQIKDRSRVIYHQSLVEYKERILNLPLPFLLKTFSSQTPRTLIPCHLVVFPLQLFLAVSGLRLLSQMVVVHKHDLQKGTGFLDSMPPHLYPELTKHSLGNILCFTLNRLSFTALTFSLSLEKCSCDRLRTMEERTDDDSVNKYWSQ